MAKIIVLALIGWAVASVIVALLASTVFRGARTRPRTITLPPEYIDLTDPATDTAISSTEPPGSDTAG
jgi:hypothetical protein